MKGTLGWRDLPSPHDVWMSLYYALSLAAWLKYLVFYHVQKSDRSPKQHVIGIILRL